MKQGAGSVKILILLCIAHLLSACAAQNPRMTTAEPAPVAAPALPFPSDFTILYDSDPPGAIFYENGKDRIGETPFVATYAITDTEQHQGFITIVPATVVWQSGATADNFPGLVLMIGGKNRERFTFIRPDAAAGKDKDYAYGLKRLMNRIEKGESTVDSSQQ